MSAARALGAIYLATASVFGVAIALNQHPDWQRAAHDAGGALASFADAHVIAPATHAGRHELVALFDALDPQQRHLAPAARPAPIAVARAVVPQRSLPLAPREAPYDIQTQIEIDQLLRDKANAAAQPVAPAHHDATESELAALDVRPAIAAAPTLDTVPARPAAAAAAPVIATPPAPPRLALAPQPPSPDVASAAAPQIQPSATEIVRVVDRLKQNLTPEMLANFGLFLYVSKAEDGPLAQRMYVFDKGDGGDLALKYAWPVSTGRERVEFNAAGQRLPSFTPQGYYELDPQRMYRHYTSSQWGQQMPYAMFFNWIKDGSKTGLAIHAATGADVAMLGHRASAGCIHIAPEDARVLYSLIKEHYKGLAPRFAYDRRTGTMSNDGILLHDPSGHLQMAEGYKVLVFIENYGGNDNVVAALF